MPNNREVPSMADVTTHLRQVKYPADKDALLQCARAVQAPEAVLHVIGEVGDRVYGGVAEVSEAVERVLIDWGKAPDEDPVEKASEDSFPASDPPGYASSRHIGKPPSEK